MGFVKAVIPQEWKAATLTYTATNQSRPYDGSVSILVVD